MRPVAKTLLLLLAMAAFLVGNSGLTYSQLRQFIKSSMEQKLRDKDVAQYLKRQTVQFAIDDALIEEFVGLGIGSKTLKALEAMQTASAGLAKPPPQLQTPSTPPQLPPPDAETQRRIIEEARRQAQTYMSDLPNYICLQVTRRYFDPTGLQMDWLKHDEIKTRVSYIDGREDYEPISVNNVATTRSFSELGGTTSTGEFGTILDSLFSYQTNAEFQWARHSLLRGHPVYVFHVKVPRSRSNWTLTSTHGPSEQSIRRVRAGYTGLVYIDKRTGRVLRIVMEAQSIPVDFPMQEARSRLDYDFIELSDGHYLLPLKAQTYVRAERVLTRNELEFRLYRKFTAEAIITFEEIEGLEPLPQDEGEE